MVGLGMTAATATLTDFLLARLDEDAASAHQSMREPKLWAVVRRKLPGGHYVFAQTATPHRMLADVEAKRRIVELASSPGPQALRLLALPYADHPDYRPEWRP